MTIVVGICLGIFWGAVLYTNFILYLLIGTVFLFFTWMIKMDLDDRDKLK